MAEARSPSQAPAQGLPKLVDLNDWTVLLPERGGGVRMSANRARWWNGRAWQTVADSTPWNARLDEKGERWWDGVEWRPRAHTLPVWERRPFLAATAGSWLLWVVLMAAGVLPGMVGLILLVVVFLPGLVLTMRSKILRTSEKGLYVLSVVGMAVLRYQDWRRGRPGAGRADGRAHLQI